MNSFGAATWCESVVVTAVHHFVYLAIQSLLIADAGSVAGLMQDEVRSMCLLLRDRTTASCDSTFMGLRPVFMLRCGRLDCSEQLIIIGSSHR